MTIVLDPMQAQNTAFNDFLKLLKPFMLWSQTEHIFMHENFISTKGEPRNKTAEII